MSRQQQIAAFGSALALAMFLAAMAVAQDWINPDGTSAATPETDDPAGGVEPAKGSAAEHASDADAPSESRREIPPGPLNEPGAVFPRTADFPIPSGHYPPPGACRLWFPDRPPGHQPPPGPCETLQLQVPLGATLIRG